MELFEDFDESTIKFVIVLVRRFLIGQPEIEDFIIFSIVCVF
jgi:hypothetical protein